MSDRGSDPVKSPKYIDFKDFASVRKKVELSLRAPEGKRFYRSLDELADTGDFRAMMDREFPQAAAEWDDGVSRRNFMKLMGASLALAGMTTACAPKPSETIVPYVQQPEILVPGKPLFYASTMPWAGFGKGVLVEQHEGRPTKVEGNKDHPASRGASDLWGQATILTMYDPDRSQAITKFGNVTSWGRFVEALSDALSFEDWNGAKATRRAKPARVRILTETVTSPTLKAQVEAIKGALGGSLEWHAHDAVGRDNTREGARQAFGEDVTPIYNFSAAATIVALDSNFFVEDPGSLRYARDYVESRRVRALTPEARLTNGNRLYAIESSPTVVGAMADHRLRVNPAGVHAFAAALLAAVKSGKAEGATFAGAKWFGSLVAELLKNKGKSLVVAGEYAPVEVHVLAHALNDALGNIAANPGEWQPTAAAVAHKAGEPGTHPAEAEAKPAVAAGHEGHDHAGHDHHEEQADPVGKGKPVALIPAVEASPAGGAESLRKLTDAVKAGDVDVLLIVGGNPAYTAPADLKFADALKSVYAGPGGKGKFFVAHTGLYEDETARLCEWHVPETHWLEAWGDVLAFDGTASIIQPLIAPIYQAARSPVEILAAVLERATPASKSAATKPAGSPVAGSTSGYEIVRGVWRDWLGKNGGGDFEPFWTKSVHDGVVGKADAGGPAKTASAPKAVAFKGDVAKASTPAPAKGGLTLLLRPDANVWDGSLANNAWLQEMPRPLTKITWDNALLISPQAAKDLGLTDETTTGNVFREDYSKAKGKTVDLNVPGVGSLTGVPVWVLPGHPDKCATLHLGYGRKNAGRVGSPTEGQVGFDAYALRTAGSRWAVDGVEVKKSDATYKLAITQNHQVINRELNHKRELVLAGTSIGEVANEYAHEVDEKAGKGEAEGGHSHGAFKYDEGKNIALARRVGLPVLPDDPGTSPVSLFPEQPDHKDEHADGRNRNDDYAAWGMVIDQTACIGCQACVMACVAENNIPVVGKEQVLNEREMHWLRIDTYYVGRPVDEADVEGHGNTVDISEPEATYFQPLPCMQCEKAPCELVCPVGATIHSKEGLNDMAYNRCVGTRYCSNNCPYKVRRFNFLKYQDDTTPVLKLARNPEVSVRSRGVMEKCTYCVQRISRGRIEAKKAEVAAKVGGASAAGALKVFNDTLDQITTACAQACPTDAILFGNMANPESKISKLKKEPVGFHYGLLAELNTRPRTTYFARIENPHPDHRPAGHGKPGEAEHGHEKKAEPAKA